MARRTHAFLGTSAALVVVAGIGWLDTVTGPDLGFSLFYLVPIVISGWQLGQRPAMIVATGAALAWFVADSLWRGEEVLLLTGWNSATRLLIYGAVGWLVATVRADRQRLMLANDRLREMVQRETEVARTDPLTGLPNWRGLTEHLERDMERARQSGDPLSILYVDLDGFKAVNDAYGHAAGDELLREAARALRESVRASDVAARVGGDEFVVLMPGADASSAGRAGHRIVRAVAELGEVRPAVAVGASVGVACFTVIPETIDELVHYADAAMYEAKHAGKGQVMLVRFDR